MSERQDGTAEQSKAVIVSLPAEMDIAAEPAAAAELAVALGAGQPVLLVDLTSTIFIDSRGARLLYRAHREGARLGTDVRFAIDQRSVLRPLDIMGYTQVLAIYPSVAAALAAGPAPQLDHQADEHLDRAVGPG